MLKLKIKFNCIICLVFIIFFFISGSKQNEDEPDDEMMRNARKLVKDLNLDKDQFVNIEKYKIFLKKLLTGAVEAEDKEQDYLYDRVVDIMATKVPELIPTNDIVTYIDHVKIKESVFQAVKEIYGDDVSDQYMASMEDKALEKDEI
jgi:hypothetical protein